MSAYRAAIDRTTEIINARAKNFRNLIVAVVLFSVTVITWAAFARTFSRLTFLLLFLPLCGFFLYMDNRLLAKWRSHLLNAWEKKEMEFQGFTQAVIAIPKLPKSTLDGMLTSFPISPDLATEQSISVSTREGVASVIRYVHTRQSDTLALKTIGAAVLSSVIALALAAAKWQPLTAGTLLLILPVCKRFLNKWRAKAFKREISEAQAKPDFSMATYHQLVASLKLDPAFSQEMLPAQP